MAQDSSISFSLHCFNRLGAQIMFGVKGVSRITTDAQSFSGKTTWPVGWQRHKWNNEGFRATDPFALDSSAVKLTNLLSLLSKNYKIDNELSLC